MREGKRSRDPTNAVSTGRGRRRSCSRRERERNDTAEKEAQRILGHRTRRCTRRNRVTADKEKGRRYDASKPGAHAQDKMTSHPVGSLQNRITSGPGKSEVKDSRRIPTWHGTPGDKKGRGHLQRKKRPQQTQLGARPPDELWPKTGGRGSYG